MAEEEKVVGRREVRVFGEVVIGGSVASPRSLERELLDG